MFEIRYRELVLHSEAADRAKVDGKLEQRWAPLGTSRGAHAHVADGLK